MTLTILEPYDTFNHIVRLTRLVLRGQHHPNKEEMALICYALLAADRQMFRLTIEQNPESPDVTQGPTFDAAGVWLQDRLETLAQKNIALEGLINTSKLARTDAECVNCPYEKSAGYRYCTFCDRNL